MTLNRNPFKLFVTIDSSLSNNEDFLKQHKGYPIDNVIQIKLSKNYFTTLFKGDFLNSSSFDYNSTSFGNLNLRYNSEGLLSRLENFFTSEKYNNYNNFASDITTLILNTYNDIDINPVKLEKACKKDGQIFNYFFLSPTIIDYENSNDIQNMYDDISSQVGGIKVYQLIAREIDNMTSRNLNLDNLLQQSTSFEYQYSDLEQLYTLYNDEFWNNLQVGDSIFIEGSFNVPTSKVKNTYKNQTNSNYDIIGIGNIPIIVQFVYSIETTYGYQIPPTITLKGNNDFIWNTFLSGIYNDEGALATDFTDKEINLTEYVIVTVKKDNELIGSNLPQSILNNEIVTTEINNVIPKNYSSQYSIIGDYEILYKITDPDGFSASTKRNFSIIFTGAMNINNIIGSNTYYERYSNRLSITNLFYEYENNYDLSFIVLPYKENGYSSTEVSSLSILRDNTGDVIFSDGYSENSNSEIIIQLSNLPDNIGNDTSVYKRQSFIISNLNSLSNPVTNYINFVTVNLIIDDIQNQEYNLSSNQSIILPEMFVSIEEHSNYFFNFTNKNFSYTENVEFIFNNINTFSSKNDLENF